MQTEIIRVEKEIFEKVREHIVKTRQTIGGFFSLAAEEKLEEIIQKDNSNTLHRVIKTNQ